MRSRRAPRPIEIGTAGASGPETAQRPKSARAFVSETAARSAPVRSAVAKAAVSSAISSNGWSAANMRRWGPSSSRQKRIDRGAWFIPLVETQMWSWTYSLGRRSSVGAHWALVWRWWGIQARERERDVLAEVAEHEPGARESVERSGQDDAQGVEARLRGVPPHRGHQAIVEIWIDSARGQQ